MFATGSLRAKYGISRAAAPPLPADLTVLVSNTAGDLERRPAAAVFASFVHPADLPPIRTPRALRPLQPSPLPLPLCCPWAPPSPSWWLNPPLYTIPQLRPVPAESIPAPRQPRLTVKYLRLQRQGEGVGGGIHKVAGRNSWLRELTPYR